MRGLGKYVNRENEEKIISRDYFMIGKMKISSI